MAPINRAGPAVLRRVPAVPALAAPDVARCLEAGSWVVDGRDREAFAAAHSIKIELDSMFGTYVGWVTPFDRSLVLVPPEPVPAALAEAVTQLIRIGYERVEGHWDRGLDAWRSSGRPTRAYPTAGVDDLCHAYLQGLPVQVLDVRQQSECDSGRVPGSLHIHLGDLPGPPGRGAQRPGSLDGLRQRRPGVDRREPPRSGVRLLGKGGVSEWLARCHPGPGVGSSS